MNIIEQTDIYIRYDEGHKVVTEYINGGRTTTLKHSPNWHKENGISQAPCIFCIIEDCNQSHST